jgi:hypothetical protein
LLYRFQDQRWIGGGVARLELRQLLEISCVGYHRRILLELIQLIHVYAFV